MTEPAAEAARPVQPEGFPRHDDLPVVPERRVPRLYAAWDVAIASVLGSHFAGCLLMAINCRRLGQGRRGLWLVLGGLASLVLLLIGAFMLPDNSHLGRGIAPGILAAMYVMAKQLQGKDYQEMLDAGGRKASTWGAVGIGLACLALIGGAVLGGVYSWDAVKASRTLGKSAEVAPGKVIYYSGEVTRDQALSFGRFVDAEGLDLASFTVRLSRDGGRHLLAVVVADGAQEDPDTEKTFRQFSWDASVQCLNGAPLDILFWNEELEPRWRMEWSPPPPPPPPPPAPAKSGMQAPQSGAKRKPQ
jgi:hypothetical protein